MHVHVSCPDGEAKFWIEPIVALAFATPGLSRKHLLVMQTLVQEKINEIKKAWQRHFGLG